MSNVIYVITDPNKKRYRNKVGKHTGSKDKLSSRYGTYHPNHIVLLFIETSDASMVEKQALLEFYRYREVKKNGNISEWIDYDVNVIVRYILNICIRDLHEYKWSYHELYKYNCKNAMNMLVRYLKNTYKVRYEESNESHGYSLSKLKVMTLSYACYNILNPCNKITFEGMEAYEKHVRHVCQC